MWESPVMVQIVASLIAEKLERKSKRGIEAEGVCGEGTGAGGDK